MLATLRRIVNRGALETAARTKQFIGQAIRYGIASGRAERDVTADLRGALPSPKRGHFPAITEPKPLAQLLCDIDAYSGNFVVRTALQLQPLIFARPANLAAAEWTEFDLEAAEWRIQHQRLVLFHPALNGNPQLDRTINEVFFSASTLNITNQSSAVEVMAFSLARKLSVSISSANVPTRIHIEPAFLSFYVGA